MEKKIKTLSDLMNELTNSPKLFGRNSKEFQAVVNTFSKYKNTVENQAHVVEKQMFECNEQAIEACKQYLETHKDPRTKAGQERLKLVTEVLQHHNNQKEYLDLLKMDNEVRVEASKNLGVDERTKLQEKMQKFSDACKAYEDRNKDNEATYGFINKGAIKTWGDHWGTRAKEIKEKLGLTQKQEQKPAQKQEQKQRMTFKDLEGKNPSPMPKPKVQIGAYREKKMDGPAKK